MSRAAGQPHASVSLVGRPPTAPSGGPREVVAYATWLQELILEEPRLSHTRIAKTITSDKSESGHVAASTVATALRGQSMPKQQVVDAIITLRIADDAHRLQAQDIRTKNNLMRRQAEQACLPATNRSTAGLLRIPSHAAGPRPAPPRPPAILTALAAAPYPSSAHNQSARPPAQSQDPRTQLRTAQDQLHEALEQVNRLELQGQELRTLKQVAEDERDAAMDDRDYAKSSALTLGVENAQLRARLEELAGARSATDRKDEVSQELEQARDEARRLRRQAEQELESVRTYKETQIAAARPELDALEVARTELKEEVKQLTKHAAGLRAKLGNVKKIVDATTNVNQLSPAGRQRGWLIEPYPDSAVADLPTSYYDSLYPYDPSGPSDIDAIGLGPYPGYTGQWETYDPVSDRTIPLAPKAQAPGQGRHRR